MSSPPAGSMTASRHLLSMLDSLPPSKEVLEFYRAKLSSFESEERRWMSRLSASRGLVRRVLETEASAEERAREVKALQQAVVEMQSAIAMERKRTVKLQTENDRLKVRECENRRKMFILLEMCGKTERELGCMIAKADKDNEGISRSDVFVPEKLMRYIQESKKHSGKQSISRSAESLRIEIATLENQLVEQERCHLEQVSTLENERRILLRDQGSLRDQFEQKLHELGAHIKAADANQEEVTKELIQSRSNFRRSERSWMAEKETLYRKLQFLQHYGPNPPANLEAGFFTDQRSALRMNGDQKLRKKIQHLSSDLAEQKTLAETYRTQLLAMESEIDSLRDQTSDNKDVLKRRTEAMVQQMETVKERYKSLEKRKKVEAQGYQTDVKLLQQKIKQIEQQLVKSSLAKIKEHDYIKSIRAYEKELCELKQAVKNSGVWIV